MRDYYFGKNKIDQGQFDTMKMIGMLGSQGIMSDSQANGLIAETLLAPLMQAQEPEDPFMAMMEEYMNRGAGGTTQPVAGEGLEIDVPDVLGAEAAPVDSGRTANPLLGELGTYARTAMERNPIANMAALYQNVRSPYDNPAINESIRRDIANPMLAMQGDVAGYGQANPMPLTSALDKPSWWGGGGTSLVNRLLNR